LALSHIVQELLEANENGSTLNLMWVKSQAARKYKLMGIPKMADILQSILLKERENYIHFYKQSQCKQQVA
jgi:histone acetyltransferase (RNA polymerase elongator complex component)